LRARDGSWGVHGSNDRRRRPLAKLDATSVEQLSREGHLVEAGEGSLVLAGLDGERAMAPAMPPRWVFVAASARRPGARNGGVGFAGLAMLARQARGPLSMRHVQAGLRLVRDAERAASDARLTMNWDSGPVTRQRRSGVPGGASGDAMRAMRELQALRAVLKEGTWRLLWSLCVDGDSLRAVGRRFGLQPREAHAAIKEALALLAEAYDGGSCRI
jgi:hypothetical protein